MAGAEPYDFQKREEVDYHHSFDYLGGMLGAEILNAEEQRLKNLGKIDPKMWAATPKDHDYAMHIASVAESVMKSDRGAALEKVAFEKNKESLQWRFLNPELERGESGAKFYAFVKHCIERKVNWQNVIPPTKKRGPPGQEEEVEEEEEIVFKPGSVVEIFGLKAKPELNKKFATIIKQDPKSKRWEIRLMESAQHVGVKDPATAIEDKRPNLTFMLKGCNLMYAPVEEQPDDDDDKLKPGTTVDLCKLKAAHLNGMRGEIIHFDVDKGRYDVRFPNGDVKQVKPENVEIPLPEGWEKFWDESSLRHFYVQTKTGKRTWKHPVATNNADKFNKVREQGQTAEEDAMSEGDDDEEKKKAERAKKKRRKAKITPELVRERLDKIFCLTQTEPDPNMPIRDARQLLELSLQTVSEYAAEKTPMSADGTKVAIHAYLITFDIALRCVADFKHFHTLQEMDSHLEIMETFDTLEQLQATMEWLLGFAKTLG